MNNQENKNKQQPQESGKEGGRGQVPQKSAMKSFFAKRWTFPVIYLAASVLIVGLMYAKSKDASFEIKKPADNQQQAGPVLPGSGTAQDTTPANSAPSFMWPVGDDGAAANVSMGFYDSKASDAAKEQAVISYENRFVPHEGVDIGLKSDKPFTVVAAAKGTVLNVTEDPLMGQTVEVDNGDGYTTYYASLADVEVQKGDIVMKGQPIAKSGNNRFEKSEMNHLHFELRKDGVQIDPNTVLSKQPVGNATKSSTDTKTPAAPTSSAVDQAINGSSATNSQANSKASGSAADQALNNSSTDSSAASGNNSAASTDNSKSMDKATSPTTGSDNSAAGSNDSQNSNSDNSKTNGSGSDTSTTTQGQGQNTSTDNPSEADGQ